VCLCCTSGTAIPSVTDFRCHDEGGCHESTRFTDGSGAHTPQRRGLRTNRTVLRQGQGPAAAGRYQRLVRAIGGTGRCAGPFLFGRGSAAADSDDPYSSTRRSGEHRQAAGAVEKERKAGNRLPRTKYTVAH
jgi:hypothetical protein